jgi:hypothetical protein
LNLGHVALLYIPTLLACLAIPYSGIMSLLPRYRPSAKACLSGCIVFLASTFFAMRAGLEVRLWSYGSFADRSVALIEAIEAYESQHGHPPDFLRKLVPEFIPQIPSPGVPAAAWYRYYTGEAEADRLAGNPWMLRIDVPELFRPHVLTYDPLQARSDQGRSGGGRFVAGWVYEPDDEYEPDEES